MDWEWATLKWATLFSPCLIGMPVTKDPFFKRYISNLGPDNVEPLFKQLKTDRPDLQLLMVVLPGKTPVYGEHGYTHTHVHVHGGDKLGQ